ncbi:DMT family transporter [Pseudoclavibacter chungangensis]|uniref:DMT family transporter n=1 Tax=Pseudoclavibacter chungangensis TaxID=587635 RepID=A0A7J5BRE1_9MICO|nr:DMT family transporter [Pseudoclavibacter chungangensis]
MRCRVCSAQAPSMSRSTLALASLTVLLYAANYPLAALALGATTPFLLLTIRFTASAVALWGIVRARRSTLPRGRALAWTILAGAGVQGAQFLSAYRGMSHGVSPTVTALVIAMNPVLTAVLLGVVTRRRESPAGVVALVLATASVLLGCLPRGARRPTDRAGGHRDDRRAARSRRRLHPAGASRGRRRSGRLHGDRCDGRRPRRRGGLVPRTTTPERRRAGVRAHRTRHGRRDGRDVRLRGRRAPCGCPVRVDALRRHPRHGGGDRRDPDGRAARARPAHGPRDRRRGLCGRAAAARCR